MVLSDELNTFYKHRKFYSDGNKFFQYQQKEQAIASHLN